MKTLQIFNELASLGFNYGIFHVKNKHLSIVSKMTDKDVFIDISICSHKDIIGYMTTLQIEGKIIISDILSNEVDFDTIIDTIKTHLKTKKEAFNGLEKIKSKENVNT